MKRKKKKIDSKLLIFISAVLTVLIVSSFIVLSNRPFEVRNIPLKVEVGEVIGISADGEILNFGTIIPGQKIIKRVTLSNSFAQDIEVRIFLDGGNISQFVYGESVVIMEENSSKEYEVNLVLPKSVEKGVYEGELIIKFFK